MKNQTRLIYLSLMLTFLMALLSGCIPLVEKDKTREANLKNMLACPLERPLSCSSVIEPVCGVFGDGATLDYQSGCLACTRRSIAGYLPGACPR